MLAAMWPASLPLSPPADPSEHRLHILLPLPFDTAFDYISDSPLAPGTLVHVPFGAQTRVGVVWNGRGGDRPVDAAKLKPVIQVLELPPLTDELRRLVDRTADYTLAPAGSVLRMVLSCPAALGPPPTRSYVVRAGAAPARLTAARRRVLGHLCFRRNHRLAREHSKRSAGGVLTEPVLDDAIFQ